MPLEIRRREGENGPRVKECSWSISKEAAVCVTLNSQSAGSEGSEADIFLHLMFPGSSVLANSGGFVKGQMY